MGLFLICCLVFLAGNQFYFWLAHLDWSASWNIPLTPYVLAGFGLAFCSNFSGLKNRWSKNSLKSTNRLEQSELGCADALDDPISVSPDAVLTRESGEPLSEDAIGLALDSPGDNCVGPMVDPMPEDAQNGTIDLMPFPDFVAQQLPWSVSFSLREPSQSEEPPAA